MDFSGVCILTGNAPRLAEFYQAVLQVEPFVEGSHYGFHQIAVYDPGDVTVPKDKTVWIMFGSADIDAEYARLLRDIPELSVISPPEKKPWGAYSFQFSDPDGNKISVYQTKKEA